MVLDDTVIHEDRAPEFCAGVPPKADKYSVAAASAS